MDIASFGQGEHYKTSDDLPSGAEPGFGYLYVIARAPDGPCKIGVSVDAQRRIYNLEASNGTRFPCLWASPLCSNYKALERFCHERLDKWRVPVGEWFDAPFKELTDELMRNLEFHYYVEPANFKVLMDAAKNVLRPSRVTNR